MTSVQAVEASGTPARPRSWGDITVTFASDMVRPNFRRGDLAELRRMNPDALDAAVFWKLMGQQDLLNHGAAVESKWALILHGIALMTPTNTGEGNTRTAHDGYAAVGRALFLGGESQREKGFYSETRLKRLLTARGPMLQTLLARLFRMMAAANVSFNWREMAQFILNDGYDEEAAEQARRLIARDYYQAERRATPSATQSD